MENDPHKPAENPDAMPESCEVSMEEVVQKVHAAGALCKEDPNILLNNKTVLNLLRTAFNEGRIYIFLHTENKDVNLPGTGCGYRHFSATAEERDMRRSENAQTWNERSRPRDLAPFYHYDTYEGNPPHIEVVRLSQRFGEDRLLHYGFEAENYYDSYGARPGATFQVGIRTEEHNAQALMNELYENPELLRMVFITASLLFNNMEQLLQKRMPNYPEFNENRHMLTIDETGEDEEIDGKQAVVKDFEGRYYTKKDEDWERQKKAPGGDRFMRNLRTAELVWSLLPRRKGPHSRANNDHAKNKKIARLMLCQ